MVRLFLTNGSGLDLVWIWFGSGLDLVWVWCGSGLGLVWVWLEFGLGLVWVWFSLDQVHPKSRSLIKINRTFHRMKYKQHLKYRLNDWVVLNFLWSDLELSSGHYSDDLSMISFVSHDWLIRLLKWLQSESTLASALESVEPESNPNSTSEVRHGP